MQSLLRQIYPINFLKPAVLIDFTRLAEREWREDPARPVFFARADAGGMPEQMFKMHFCDFC